MAVDFGVENASTVGEMLRNARLESDEKEVILASKITPGYLKMALKPWGWRLLVQNFKENPYKLMRIEGIGFKTADKWAKALGVADDDPRRLLALMNVVEQQAVNCAWDSKALIRYMRSRELGFSAEESRLAIRYAFKEGVLLAEYHSIDKRQYGVFASISKMEKTLVEMIERADTEWPDVRFESPALLDWINTDKPTDEQRQAAIWGAELPFSIVCGPAGCLSADTVLNINRAGKGSRMTIEHVVHMFNGGVSGGKTWNKQIPTRVARAEGDVIKLGVIKNAWYSGDKETFKVTTSSGRSIRGTAIHPFLTTEGWKRLEELKVGSLVLVNAGKSKRGKGPKAQYHVTRTNFHPFQVNKGRGHLGVSTHRLVVEAALNNLSFESFVEILRTSEYESKRLTFLKPELHVHHLDHNHHNNKLNNLATMTAAAHHKLHASQGKTNHVLDQVGTEEVISIEHCGVEPTYDIEVEDDPHNFLANGFVVHNTGKTTCLRGIVALADENEKQVHLMAFTGKAAKVLSDKVRDGATTAHGMLARLYGHKAYHDDQGYELKEDCDSKYGCIFQATLNSIFVVDEAGMLDIELLSRVVFWAGLLEASLVLTGDQNQLEAIGPGQPFWDIVQFGQKEGLVAITELTKNFRSYTVPGLVEGARAVLSRSTPVSGVGLDVWRYADAQEAERDLLTGIRVELANEDEWLTAPVITWRNEERKSLNLAIQRLRNPAGDGVEEFTDVYWANGNGGRGQERKVYRVGDPVVHLENQYDFEVVNGDQGVVAEISEWGEFLKVQYPNRMVTYRHREDSASAEKCPSVKNLDLAYSITCHKAQGSEYPLIKIFLPVGGDNLNLPWLYTALTRASAGCRLYATGGGLAAVYHDTRGRRLSCLPARLVDLIKP